MATGAQQLADRLAMLVKQPASEYIGEICQRHVRTIRHLQRGKVNQCQVVLSSCRKHAQYGNSKVKNM